MGFVVYTSRAYCDGDLLEPCDKSRPYLSCWTGIRIRSLLGRARSRQFWSGSDIGPGESVVAARESAKVERCA